MASDSVARSPLGQGTEVMASIEDGPAPQLIFADVSRDDAFLTLPLTDAASLSAWR